MKAVRNLADYVAPQNADCWAVGDVLDNGRFRVRRIVWGRLVAREETRQGESMRQAAIYVRKSEADGR